MRLLFLLSSIITVVASLSADSNLQSRSITSDSGSSVEKETAPSYDISTSLQTREPKDPSIETSPLLNEDDFVIFYAFSVEKLAAPLKEAMIKHFEKLGTVYLADDSKLTEKQKKEKYRIGGGMLQVIATPIIEESLSPLGPDHKVLPVVELSLKVTGGVESLSNECKFCCSIWENTKFISANTDNRMLTQNAVRSLENILDAFIADYQLANPGKKPHFYLYN